MQGYHEGSAKLHLQKADRITKSITAMYYHMTERTIENHVE